MTRNSIRRHAVVTILAALSVALVTVPGLPVRPPSAAARGGARLKDAEADFMRRVHEEQVRRAPRKPAANLPEDQLAGVEGRHRMRRDAAEQCKLLLGEAEADLRREKEEKGRQALQVTDIGVHSAYRSVDDDAVSWRRTFGKHLNATRQARSQLKGGEYGDEAVEMMVRIMRKFKAAPGFSKHTRGVAVDFKTVEGGVTLAADSNQNDRWKKSWFHRWLVKNAGRFKFKPLATEAWHWEYAG